MAKKFAREIHSLLWTLGKQSSVEAKSYGGSAENAIREGKSY